MDDRKNRGGGDAWPKGARNRTHPPQGVFGTFPNDVRSATERNIELISKETKVNFMYSTANKVRNLVPLEAVPVHYVVFWY